MDIGFIGISDKALVFGISPGWLILARLHIEVELELSLVLNAHLGNLQV